MRMSDWSSDVCSSDLRAPSAASVREVYESAICMGRLALDQLGLADAAIDNAEADYRERDGDRLTRQIETGDMPAAAERMATPATLAGRPRGSTTSTYSPPPRAPPRSAPRPSAPARAPATA